jgi:hypothetical protein
MQETHEIQEKLQIQGKHQIQDKLQIQGRHQMQDKHLDLLIYRFVDLLITGGLGMCLDGFALRS